MKQLKSLHSQNINDNPYCAQSEIEFTNNNRIITLLEEKSQYNAYVEIIIPHKPQLPTTSGSTYNWIPMCISSSYQLVDGQLAKVTNFNTSNLKTTTQHIYKYRDTNPDEIAATVLCYLDCTNVLQDGVIPTEVITEYNAALYKLSIDIQKFFINYFTGEIMNFFLATCCTPPSEKGDLYTCHVNNKEEVSKIQLVTADSFFHDEL